MGQQYSFCFLYRNFLDNYITYIYDVTVAYPRDIVQSEVDLIVRGKCSSHVHYNIRRIPISDLPKDDDGLAEWLMQTWREKDETLENFYNQRNKTKRKLDAGGGSKNLWVKDSTLQLAVLTFGCLFFMNVAAIWFWHITFITPVRITLLYLMLNYIYIYGRYGGIDFLLLQRWELWRKNMGPIHSHIV